MFCRKKKERNITKKRDRERESVKKIKPKKMFYGCAKYKRPRNEKKMKKMLLIEITFVVCTKEDVSKVSKI